MTTFRIHALPADALDAARTDGRPVEQLTAGGGEPLRCCLRDARPGEKLMLFGYAPPLPESPYREKGPVYGHAEPCAGPADPDAYPPDWARRPQVLRAYDARGWIHPATRVHDGSDPVSEITAVLATPGVVRIHSRNIAHGCYMFSVTPTSG